MNLHYQVNYEKSSLRVRKTGTSTKIYSQNGERLDSNAVDTWVTASEMKYAGRLYHLVIESLQPMVQIFTQLNMMERDPPLYLP